MGAGSAKERQFGVRVRLSRVCSEPIGAHRSPCPYHSQRCRDRSPSTVLQHNMALDITAAFPSMSRQRLRHVLQSAEVAIGLRAFVTDTQFYLVFAVRWLWAQVLVRNGERCSERLPTCKCSLISCIRFRLGLCLRSFWGAEICCIVVGSRTCFQMAAGSLICTTRTPASTSVSRFGVVSLQAHVADPASCCFSGSVVWTKR